MLSKSFFLKTHFTYFEKEKKIYIYKNTRLLLVSAVLLLSGYSSFFCLFFFSCGVEWRDEEVNSSFPPMNDCYSYK